nr:hypothetical protein [Tanacetum cinerariifolium]
MGKRKYVDTKFDRSSVVRQPNAQRIPKPSILGVNHKPTVSKPQLKSNQSRDKMKSVTACKDSLNSRTFNANVVCATCNKCLVDSNHFACVTKMLNDVYARTKKPTVVHISTKKPKSQANKSFATPHKKKVASKPTNQKPQSYFRVMYENTNKAWKWWIERQSTSRYKWVPKPKKQWVPKKKCNGYLKLRMTKCRNELSHLNFDYINLLSKKDIVIGLPKLRYVKDQLCSSCELSKAKRSSFKSKVVPSSKGRLNLLHMDLCGPMRAASINEKRYILVIVDDYSRYTWTLFLLITVRTDRGTKFLNKTLNAFFKEEGIEHQTSTARTPEQNGIVERQNRTLVKAARTMLSASKALSKDRTVLWLRLLERCSQLHNFLYSFGLKQLQPHAILKIDP